MDNKLNVEDIMVLDILQTFTELIEAPKKECLHYTPPPQPVEAIQFVDEAPKEVPIERIPCEEPLHFPTTTARHIRAQLLSLQKEEEVE
jgi:hypothetical protein